tara:strand:- start:2538 stop:3188 length:651 start_codon:yes stop_codon:yes gene_type:complete
MSRCRPSAVRLSIYTEWLTSLVIAAAVASAWRGAWILLDALFLPEQPVRSAVLSVALGAAFLVCAVAPQPALAAWARARRERRVLWAADAMYTYAASWVCVLLWRGVWALWDIGFDQGLPPAKHDMARARSGAISHAVGLVVLLVLGALRNLVASPMLIASDAATPIFGAGATAGIGALNPLTRLRRAPVVQSAVEWHSAVGVPYEPVAVDAAPSA